MNKFFVTLTLMLSLQAGAQQEAVYQFSRDYFRSDPFQGYFSGFMEHLMKDPGIAKKEIRLRSDTALFYFYGTYSSYNPFFFKPKRLEVLLEEVPFQYADSLAPKDTLLVYQLIAYGEANEKGLKEVKKEFDKIHRQYKRRFFESNFKEFKENEMVTGAMHNYFVPLHALSPVSVAWGKVSATNEPVLNITLRMKITENQAVLPVPLQNP